MKKKSVEWRVVSKNVFGTFKVFGEDEASARRFAFGEIWPDGTRIRPSSLANDPGGPHRLESRLVGGTKDDWKEVASEVVA